MADHRISNGLPNGTSHAATNGFTNRSANGATNGTSPEKTGIKVIVVGAGFGGLTAAIECHRQGHDVEIYESFPVLKSLGDIISFGPNAVAKKMRALSIDPQHYGFNIHKYTGELVANQKSPPTDESAPVFNGHRGELHEVVFSYAKDECGMRSTLDGGSRSIVLENGDKVVGDLVIGSGGFRSKARELVLGYVDKPKSSGYAIFRAWFPNTDMITDPKTAHFCNNGDTFNGWIGPDVHFLFSTIKNGSDCCWVMSHKDDADIEESWSLPGRLEDVCKVVEGWDPLCKTIVSKTPEDKFVDWKLVYRDPLPRWVSGQGRIALLGDAAHPFLPTSIQGATQAMEDGVAMAVCLKRAGKGNVPNAVRAYQEIRYDRARAVQKTGEANRDMWHKADWDKVASNPESVQLPREDWIMKHDAEKHAEEVFDDTLKQVSR